MALYFVVSVYFLYVREFLENFKIFVNMHFCLHFLPLSVAKKENNNKKKKKKKKKKQFLWTQTYFFMNNRNFFLLQTPVA